MSHFAMFLCEDASIATFNRVNFSGCLMNPELLIQGPLYYLRTQLVLIAPFEQAMRGQEVRWGAKFAGTLPEYSLDGAFHGGVVPDDPSLETMTMAFPLDLELRSEGRLQTIVSIGEANFVREWRVRLGAAPGKKPSAPLASSGIFAPGASAAFNVSELLRSATNMLAIIDGYLPATELMALVGATSAKVQVLTAGNHRNSYLDARTALAVDLPNLEVRFLKGHFHDRFVIVNSDEVYTFGHSLKDLGRSVSVFRKVYELALHDEITAEFRAAWPRASPL